MLTKEKLAKISAMGVAWENERGVAPMASRPPTRTQSTNERGMIATSASVTRSYLIDDVKGSDTEDIVKAVEFGVRRFQASHAPRVIPTPQRDSKRERAVG